MVKKKISKFKDRQLAKKFDVSQDDTLAVKKTRNLQSLVKNSAIIPAWWTRVGEYLGFIILGILNLWLLWPIIGNPDPSTPFSGPVVPVLAWLISFTFHLPKEYSLGILWIIFLWLMPVFLSVMVKEITKRRVTGLISGLIASLPILFFSPSRIESMFQAADGPHIVGLSITPLAVLAWLKFCRNGGIKELFFASSIIALVALTSPFALLSLTIILVFTAFSEMLLSRARLKLARLMFAVVLAVGFSSFWYNPKFIWLLLKSDNGQEVMATFWRLVPISFVVVPILATFGFLLFERKKDLQPIFLSLFLTIAFILLIVFGRFPGHPRRFYPELGLTLAFFLGVCYQFFVDWLRSIDLKKIKGRQLPKFFKTNQEKIAWAITGILILAVIIFSLLKRESLENYAYAGVLGLVDPMQKTSVWQLRNLVSWGWRLVGVLISLFTVGLFLSPLISQHFQVNKEDS